MSPQADTGSFVLAKSVYLGVSQDVNEQRKQAEEKLVAQNNHHDINITCCRGSSRVSATSTSPLTI